MPKLNAIDCSEISVFQLKELLLNENSSNHEQAIKHLIDWIEKKETFIFNTSGSTGTPKSIHIDRIKIEKAVEASNSFFKYKPKSVSWVTLNTNFIAGFMQLIRAYEAKMKIYVTEPCANPLMNWTGFKADVISLIPAQCFEMLADNRMLEALNEDSVILIGGAQVSDELSKKIQALPFRFYETYGMTETLSHVAIRKINGLNKQEQFEALSGIKFSISEKGNLNIHAPWVDDIIETKDQIELISESAFKWLGRESNCINSGGMKYYAEELERKWQNLLFENGISNSVLAIGFPDIQWGEVISMVIEAPEIISELKNEIKKWDKKIMPRRLISSKLFFLPNGKIDRIKTKKVAIDLGSSPFNQ